MRRLAALLLLMIVACGGDAGPPTLSVQVVGESGSPIIESRVLVSDAVTGDEIGRGITDEEGWFRIELPGPGEYEVNDFHLVGDPPCWWDIGTTTVDVGSAGGEVSLTGVRVCT